MTRKWTIAELRDLAHHEVLALFERDKTAADRGLTSSALGLNYQTPISLTGNELNMQIGWPAGAWDISVSLSQSG